MLPEPTESPEAATSAPLIADVQAYVKQLPHFDRPPAPPPPFDFWATNPTKPLFRVPTTQRVAFLTIDDGFFRRPEALPLLKASGIRITLFLKELEAEKDPAYFRALVAAGALVENHTITHTSLKGKPYAFQHYEICGAADKLARLFGRRPTLFRPPYGNYDQNTLRAAHDCGQQVVVYWTETVDHGVVRYQSGDTVGPGHMILMHFRPNYADDFVAALQAMKRSGVTPALLEDYIQGGWSPSASPVQSSPTKQDTPSTQPGPALASKPVHAAAYWPWAAGLLVIAAILVGLILWRARRRLATPSQTDHVPAEEREPHG